MKKTLTLITLTLTLILSGCGSSTPTPNKQIKQYSQSIKKIDKEYAQWFEGRDEKVPLTIVNMAYINPKLKRTKEYKQYKNLINMLRKNPNALDSVLGFELTSKFSSVEVIDFSKSSDEKQRFNAAYNNKSADKESLTDILRPDEAKPSAEILLRLDYKELRKGILKIEGYKSIKTEDEARNSYYFELVKPDYKKLSKKAKKQAVVNSLSAALRLSIPEYLSVDRKKLFNEKENLTILKEYEKEKFEATIFKPKEINKYKSVNSSQIIYTKPLSYDDIKILYATNYIKFAKEDDFTLTDINSVTTVLNRDFLDPILIASFPKIFEEIEDVSIFEDALVVYKKDLYSVGELLTSSKSTYDKSIYKKTYQNDNFITQDIESGFAFTILDYIDSSKDPKLKEIYLQFKDDKVLNFDKNGENGKDGIDTAYYLGDGVWKTDFTKSANCLQVLLVIPMHDDKCSSTFYDVNMIESTTLTLVGIFASFGILTGYIVHYNPESMYEYINDSNFRNLEQFKSKL